jgi:lipopolysaccharide biosynthesis glycosyltransferase
MWKND